MGAAWWQYSFCEEFFDPCPPSEGSDFDVPGWPHSQNVGDCFGGGTIYYEDYAGKFPWGERYTTSHEYESSGVDPSTDCGPCYKKKMNWRHLVTTNEGGDGGFYCKEYNCVKKPGRPFAQKNRPCDNIA